MDLIHELKDAAGNYAEIVRRSGAPGSTGWILIRQADGTYVDASRWAGSLDEGSVLSIVGGVPTWVPVSSGVLIGFGTGFGVGFGID